MLTAHDRLTAPGVVIHLPRYRARARKSRRALWLRPRPSQSAFANPVPVSTSAADSESVPLNSSRLPIQSHTKAIWRPLKPHN